MMHQDDRHDEFRPVIERLRADRPTATPLELDATKQRVLARVARPRPTTRRSFSLMRTRAAILSMLALGFLLSTTGVGLAVSGLSDNNQASSAQYGPTPTPTSTNTPPPTSTPTSETPPATSTTPPTTTAPTTTTTAPAAPGPEVTTSPAPESNVLGEHKENKPQTQQPSEVLPEQAQTAPAAVQPARQVQEAGSNELPFTGFAALPVLLLGLVLLSAGLVMRRSSAKD
jgi:outer membrane biosynthesis protein TonB